MDWLNQIFAEQSVAWLLITSVAAVVSGFVSSLLTYRFVKRQEITDTTRLQGEVRKEVEAFLADKSAEREYNLEARKRLYRAIGPLRFQLLIACKEAATRILNYSDSQNYKMSIQYYFGQNTLYRLIRPLAIAELIEQQITYADFSVDPAALELLRFKKAMSMALSDGDIILNHPKADWTYQAEHLFSATIGSLANSFTIPDNDASTKKRPMNFPEFKTFIQDKKNLEQFEPLVTILERLSPTDKPIFWARLVCLGYICNEYIGQSGRAIGFENYSLDLDKMLSVSADDFILSNIERYKKVFQSLVNISL